jgi:hypothetical protein
MHSGSCTQGWRAHQTFGGPTESERAVTAFNTVLVADAAAMRSCLGLPQVAVVPAPGSSILLDKDHAYHVVDAAYQFVATAAAAAAAAAMMGLAEGHARISIG